MGRIPSEGLGRVQFRGGSRLATVGLRLARCLVHRDVEGVERSSWRPPGHGARRPLSRGFEALTGEHERWWASYWDRTAISVPNAVIERQWYLETAKFGSAARANTLPITLQGPWTADDMKIPPWKGDYHHDLNTQLSYWPAYSGNRLEGAEGYVRWLWDTRENARAWTKRFFDLPGLNVPMTADLEQNQIGGWHQYTHSATTAAWLAHHFWLHWRYSMDRQFLMERPTPGSRTWRCFWRR